MFAQASVMPCCEGQRAACWLQRDQQGTGAALRLHKCLQKRGRVWFSLANGRSMPGAPYREPSQEMAVPGVLEGAVGKGSVFPRVTGIAQDLQAGLSP